MALVYSYIRFSSKEQAKGGSLNRQTEMGDEWIKKNNHTKAESYHDLSCSAFKGKNKHKGALKAFLNDVEKGKIKKGSILLVEHVDRMSRQGVMEAFPVWLEILNTGIKIAVLKPTPTIYSKPKNETDAFIGLLLPLVYFHLAHIESKTKSDRIKREWVKKRKNTIENGVPLSKRCPSWLEWDSPSNSFKINPIGEKAIKHIFERTVDGIGQRSITIELAQSFTPIGTSEEWNSSFIQKVLDDRAVLGELQMFSFNDKDERIPQGDPIKDYYPRLISDELWYKAQQSKANRKRHKGPNGNFVNLFTGLIYNGHDKTKCHIQSTRAKRKNGNIYIQRRLVSDGHKKRLKGSSKITCNYKDLESAILYFLKELKTSDLIPEVDKDFSILEEREDELLAVGYRLTELQKKIEDIDSDNLDTILKAASNLEYKKKKLLQDVERLKIDFSSSEEDNLINAQNLLDFHNQAEGNEQHEMRLKLRALMPNVIKDIWIVPFRLPKRKTLTFVQVNLMNGRFRQMMMTANNVTAYPDSIPKTKNDYRNGVQSTKEFVEFLIKKSEERNTSVENFLIQLF
jgi:DNA invertase Pin-like site-specific DNA recombinase